MLKFLEQKVREWLAEDKEEYEIGRVKSWDERTTDLVTEIELSDGSVDYSEQVGFVVYTYLDGTRNVREFSGHITYTRMTDSNNMDIYMHAWTGEEIGYVVLRVRNCSISPIDLII